MCYGLLLVWLAAAALAHGTPRLLAWVAWSAEPSSCVAIAVPLVLGAAAFLLLMAGRRRGSGRSAAEPLQHSAHLRHRPLSRVRLVPALRDGRISTGTLDPQEAGGSGLLRYRLPCQVDA